MEREEEASVFFSFFLRCNFVFTTAHSLGRERERERAEKKTYRKSDFCAPEGGRELISMGAGGRIGDRGIIVITFLSLPTRIILLYSRVRGKLPRREGEYKKLFPLRSITTMRNREREKERVSFRLI